MTLATSAANQALCDHRLDAAHALSNALGAREHLVGAVFLSPVDLLARFGDHALEEQSRALFLLAMSLGRVVSLRARNARKSCPMTVPLLRAANQLLLEYEHWAQTVGLVARTASAAVGALLGSAAAFGSSLAVGFGADEPTVDTGEGYFPTSVLPREVYSPPPGGAASLDLCCGAPLGQPRLHRTAGGSVAVFELLLTEQLLQPFGPSLGFVECACAALDMIAQLYESLRESAASVGPGVKDAPSCRCGEWTPAHTDSLLRFDRRLKTCVLKPLTLFVEAAALAKVEAGFDAELGALSAAFSGAPTGPESVQGHASLPDGPVVATGLLTPLASGS